MIKLNQLWNMVAGGSFRSLSAWKNFPGRSEKLWIVTNTNHIKFNIVVNNNKGASPRQEVLRVKIDDLRAELDGSAQLTDSQLQFFNNRTV
jgi:hypothetical protein